MATKYSQVPIERIEVGDLVSSDGKVWTTVKEILYQTSTEVYVLVLKEDDARWNIVGHAGEKVRRAL